MDLTLKTGESDSESCSVMSDSLLPHGLYGPWNSPGQNTRVGNFSRGSSQPRSPALQVDSNLLKCCSPQSTVAVHNYSATAETPKLQGATWGWEGSMRYPASSSAVVQSLSHVRLFKTPRTAAPQASLSITISRSLLKLMSIESVMPSNHLILCYPLLLPPSIFPSIRVFSNELALCSR